MADMFEYDVKEIQLGGGGNCDFTVSINTINSLAKETE